jgi:predicted nucleic acid-binding protein
VILIDANVIMYAAGAEHPNKRPCAEVVDLAAQGQLDAALDAEVLQEVLHRYRAIRRWADGRRVYDLARMVFPLVLPVTAEILDRARRLLDLHEGIMARDALHAAVVLVEDLEGICSCERDFDRLPEIRRLDPADLG